MLLPALAKAKVKANATRCVANQKQQYLGYAMYSSDNQDLMPAHGDWATVGGEIWSGTAGVPLRAAPGKAKVSIVHDGNAWETNRPLNVYVPAPEAFRCPSDKGDSYWAAESKKGCYPAWGNSYLVMWAVDWFGVKQIFVSEDTAGFYNPKVIQSTMGSCFRVRVESVNLETIVKATALPVYGAQLNGTSMYETAIAPTGFLMIGNESKGIGNHLTKYITHPIKIPKYGNAESLNAAVATGIILSHWKV